MAIFRLAVSVLLGVSISLAQGLTYPTGVALDGKGGLYIADAGSHCVFRLDLKSGQLSSIAGTGAAGFSGDGGPARRAALFSPHALAVHADGSLFIADTLNHRIRRIDPAGMISTYAAGFNGPQGIRFDREGRLLVADTFNSVVRRVEKDGNLTVIAGSEVGLSGDGGPATAARMNLPVDVEVGPDGTLYIAEAGNSRVRMVSPDGTLTTLTGNGGGAGLGGAGFSGDGGPAARAKLFAPSGLVRAANGDLYVADSGNNRIRVVNQTTTSLNGSDRAGFNTPFKICLGADGTLYVADRGNGRVIARDPGGTFRTLVSSESPHGSTFIGATSVAAVPPARAAVNARTETTTEAALLRRTPDHEQIHSPAATPERLTNVSLPAAGAPGVPVTPRTLVDRILFAAWQRDRIPHAPLSNDYEFARRVHLDLTGRIPPAGKLSEFVASKDPAKRDQLIEELLDSPAWVDYWAYWFGDLMRITQNRIGDASTKHFDQWLRASLRSGKPYNRLVTELLTATAPTSNWMPDAAPSAFLSRNFIAGVTMYTDQYEDTADEIMVQSSRLFLGINYQCISCHGGRGFLEKVDLGLLPKTRKDFWSMAAFFGKTKVRAVWYQDRYAITDDGAGYDTNAASMVRLQRTGGQIEPTFLLTGEKADPTQPLRPQFARMLTSHPQFARATVNLIWKQLFGMGIVEPVDGFDMARQDPKNPPPAPWTIQPANPELLEALARDFAANGYNLKHLMRTLARSSVYQLSSRFDGEWKESYTPYFARHFVRRLSAEQMHDAVAQATSVTGGYQLRDLVYGTPLPVVQFWTQVASPEQIGNREAKSFLQAFGLANREQFDRQQSGSIMQALMLMNSPFVNRRVRIDGDTLVAKLVKSERPAAELVNELYLSTLSRPPSPPEKDLALSWLAEDRSSLADLHWALLNKLDFILNY